MLLKNVFYIKGGFYMNIGAHSILIRWEDLTKEKQDEILKYTKTKPKKFDFHITVYEPIDILNFDEEIFD